MFEQLKERKRHLGIKWVRSQESGESYLCPVGVLKESKNLSERDLKRFCVIESNNPQND